MCVFVKFLASWACNFVSLFLLFANKGAGLLTFKEQYSFHFHILSVSIHFASCWKPFQNKHRSYQMCT